jgi:hypothetical protein
MVSPQNDLYGHRGLLCRYAGVPTGRRIWGAVQHGWQIRPQRTGALAAVQPRHFVWGRRDLAMGDRAFPIGAPLLYHPAIERVGDPEGDQLLVLPYHGFGVDLDDAHAKYARYLESLRNEVNDITVCLHPKEFVSPVREIYSRCGYVVVTNGDGKDPQFMERQIRRIFDHGTVTTNRPSTGLFYAAALRRRVFVAGPFPRSEDRLMEALRLDYAGQVALYRSEFRTLLEGLEGDDAQAFGNRELGREFVREPDELRSVLGLDGLHRALGRAIALGNGARRTVLRVRNAERPEAVGVGGEEVDQLENLAWEPIEDDASDIACWAGPSRWRRVP